MNEFSIFAIIIVILSAINALLFRKYYMPDFTEIEYLPDTQSDTQSPPYEPVMSTSTPTEANKPGSEPPRDMLVTFCTAIRDFEGGPTNINYKQNNPGNCRCSPIGYLPKYGNVRCVNNFAFFPTYELGWQYLQNLVHHRAELHPQWTIIDFFENYAPTGDNNNPQNYAIFVAKRCGVIPTTTLQKLFV